MKRPESELLTFWVDTLPLPVVRLYRKLLPSGVDIPSAPVDEAELLSFYQRVVPKRLQSVLGRVLELSFPVFDARHLTEQLSESGKPLDPVARDLVASLRARDFPLQGLRPTLDIVSVRTLSYMFASCWQSYSECRRKTDPNGEPRQPTTSELAKCDADYQACSDGVSMQVFVAATADLWRPAFPSRWRPWWRWPEPDPEPSLLRL